MSLSAPICIQVVFLVETVHYRDRRRRHHYVRREYKFLHEGKNHMAAVTVNVGHVVNCSLLFLDQNGNPLQTTPTPDAPPAWSDSTPATGTLTVAPGGLTASETAVAVGSDVISVSLAVAGVSFSATLPITVTPAPQVLTAIAIAATVV